jgi:hypothetical protein
MLSGCCGRCDGTRSVFPSMDAAGLIVEPGKKYVLLNLQKLGLANRLRAVSDWYVVSRQLGRDLIVSWKPFGDCQIGLDEMFDSFPLHMSLIKELPFEGDQSLKFVDDAAKNANISAHVIYGAMESRMWQEPFTSFVLASRFSTMTETVLATSYDGVLTFHNLPCQVYAFKRSQALQQLQPKQQYLDVINNLLDQYFGTRNMIAVHMRVHDEVQDWEVVPPAGESAFAQRFGEGASVEDFTGVMTTVQRHFGCTNTSDTSCPVRFFIASNGLDQKNALLNAFPDSISIQCDLDRNTFNGMQCAFIEWLIIARASLILHTYGSSYAEEASQLYMRPLISIWNKVLVHHRNVYLPYCGVMQYAKYFSPHAKSYTFQEGTHDKRQVSGLN